MNSVVQAGFSSTGMSVYSSDIVSKNRIVEDLVPPTLIVQPRQKAGSQAHLMLKIKIALTAALIFLGSGFAANAQTALVDTFRDWATYQHTGALAKICFALSQPTDTTSENDTRKPVFFYVSAWPKDGVKAEISIKMGHMIKKDSITTVKIGSARFRLLSEADKAFVDDATAELKLIQSMKKGSEMEVESISAAGNKITDTYSLRGITKAIKSLASTCS